MSMLVIELAVLQVGLPLVFIVANVLIPSASRLNLSLRSAAIGLLIGYTALAGIWLFPPWWTPYALFVLHVVGTSLAFWRWHMRKPASRGWLSASEFALGLLASVGAISLLVPAVQGRAVPGEAVDLAMPLGPGTYQVVSGGASLAINAHLATLTLDRAKPYRGQSYAVDIIGIDTLGFHADGIAPADPRLYHIYGAQVRSPCAGKVVYLVDGVPDMQVPEVDRQHMLGNGVLLACGDHHVLLAHLAPNTVTVALGDRVEIGQELGRVGNSGNTSEPHLHVHVQRGMPDDMPISSEPIWFTVDGRFLLRNQVFNVIDRD